jgi:hypothetical protein
MIMPGTQLKRLVNQHLRGVIKAMDRVIQQTGAKRLYPFQWQE